MRTPIIFSADQIKSWDVQTEAKMVYGLKQGCFDCLRQGDLICIYF